VGHLIADVATKVPTARLLTADGAEKLDSGVRGGPGGGDGETLRFGGGNAGHAGRHAGARGYAYSKEFDVERYSRDAPLMVLGEGTNEIQRTVIAA
jgi:alkylation response protein AidB-like acyl-CoA dehydrogenase